MSRFIGNVSAYAYAVSQGYTGTEEEYAELMASYATVAEQAAESAESASASATSASASATTATTKASEASQSATQAGTKASEASTSATQASASATSASQSASTATTKASEASASASTASTKASEASTSATTASSKASEASASATSAQTAQGLAESARDDAIDAKTDAETARDMAQQYAESIDPENIYSAYPTDTASGSVASFADGADDIPLKSCIVQVNPVQDLHGYDHPWPAGGGKNLFGLERWLTDNEIAYTKTGDSYTFTLAQKLFIQPFVFSKTDAAVTLSFESFANGTSVNARMTLLDSSNNAIKTIYADRTNVKTTATACKVRMDWETGGAGTVTIKAPQIELGSTATAYSPYSNICPISGWDSVVVSHSGADTTNPTTHSITFPSEAGTVYGGTLDVTNGTLTVDMAMIASYNGEVLPSTWISDRDKYVAGTTPTTGAQVCYKLSQAVVYHLTPTEIKSLLGDNNVWADAGDTEVTYRADTAKYIDKKIAEVINALS